MPSTRKRSIKKNDNQLKSAEALPESSESASAIASWDSFGAPTMTEKQLVTVMRKRMGKENTLEESKGSQL